MNRREFKSLMGDMTNLLENVQKEEVVLAEATESNGIRERIHFLKGVNKSLKEEDAKFTDVKAADKTGVEGLAAEKGAGPKGWSDDSSKPRLIPTADMKANTKKLQGGLVSKLDSNSEDAVNMNKRSGGKAVSEEPEAEGADESYVSEPETYGEAIEQLRRDWKRLMGEASWSMVGGGSMGTSSLPKTSKLPISKPKPSIDIAKLGGEEVPDMEKEFPHQSYVNKPSSETVARIQALKAKPHVPVTPAAPKPPVKGSAPIPQQYNRTSDRQRAALSHDLKNLPPSK